jgi:ABC-type multidrug transport system ATPase subunit
LQLLQDVSGAFRPGTLTALVGVSGAGKTTLMDVLAGRKIMGYIEGSISISGYPKNQVTFARSVVIVNRSTCIHHVLLSMNLSSILPRCVLLRMSRRKHERHITYSPSLLLLCCLNCFFLHCTNI